MLKLPDQIQIKDVQTDSFRDAAIVKLRRQLAQREIDGRWWRGINWIADPEKEEDSDWPWDRIVREVEKDQFAECVGVRLADGSIQGAIRYRLDGKSWTKPTSASVKVEFLATAPRNRDWLTSAPEFSGVGTALLFRAVCHSWLLGFQGRVVLEAIPAQNTLEFYDNRGFRRVTELEDGTIGCELEPLDARQWLIRNGVST